MRQKARLDVPERVKHHCTANICLSQTVNSGGTPPQ